MAHYIASTARFFGIFMSLLLMVSAGVWAQAIMINEKPFFDALKAEGNTHIDIANGPFSYKDGTPLSDSSLQPFARILLSVLAHQALEEEKIKLDSLVSETLPDLIEDVPFELKLRFVHLISGTSGFLVPDIDPRLYDGPFAPLLMRLRTPGRMLQPDPVGLTILGKMLEEIYKTSLKTLITTKIFEPLGIASDTITIFEKPLLSGQISQDARTALLTLLYERRIEGLSRERVNDFQSLPLIIPFPGGPYNSLGLTHAPIGDDIAIVIGRGFEECIVAFPKAELAIFIAGPSCRNPHKSKALKDLAHDAIIHDETAYQASWQQYNWPERFSGYFIEDSIPSASLENRLDAMINRGLYVQTLKDGSIALKKGSDVKLYTRVTSNLFRGENNETLYFSQIRRGGFFWLDGEIYRDQSLLAEPKYVVWPVPVSLLLLLSAIVYRGANIAEWRRIGIIAPLGAICLFVGVTAEHQLWHIFMFDMPSPWLILGWRLIMNIGIALSLAVSIQTLIIARKGLMPEGWRAFTAPVHLMALAGSGVGLVFLMAAWGIAGDLWPY